MYDINQSHATFHIHCFWWSRKTHPEEEYEPDELVMKRVADGDFWAKEVAPVRTQNMQVGGAFLIEKDTITLKSPDNLENIASEDLIEFNDEKWIVVDCQRSKARIQNTYFAKDNNCSHYWYLELRK